MTLGFVVAIVLGLSLSMTVVEPPLPNDPCVGESVHPTVEAPLPLRVPCHVSVAWPLLLMVNVGHALAVQMPSSWQVVPEWQM